ncbi:zinc finger protein 227-like isoform X1 [Macrobrachium rosenbergii]|uniref:zinc finger protein 227-like isoform X1 n=2 Tax=Macrobrachium rosenbergii TaxID=79674 RepID=UPI0034D55229
MEKEKQLKCIICGKPLSSVYHYHKHNVRQHSLVELSRSILKLQELQLPLTDPTSDEDEDEEEEERRRLELDMADVLDLPIKCELMDEEVIELGPTENADDLQVKSRLVKNPNNTKQESRQIIEFQEFPPCYINPAIEDPDAIVVKFNRELVMALDNTQASVCTTFPQKNKFPNRNLRAVCKRNIEIPDPVAFAKDYSQIGSHTYDKYIMQKVILREDPPKRGRGRPRKTLKPMAYLQTEGKTRGLDRSNEGMEDEDMEDLEDPLLLSDNEDDEKSATVPNVIRSRSGRVIKTKKGDSTFKYYGIPGQTLEHEELSSHAEWRDVSQNKVKVKFKRRRKPLGDGISEQVHVDNMDNPAVKNSSTVLVSNGGANNDVVKVELSEMEEGVSMPVITHHVEDDNYEQIGTSKSVDITDENFECLLCFRSFCSKDWEKHTQEHLTDSVAKSGDMLNSSSSVDPEKLLNSDEKERNIDDKEERSSPFSAVESDLNNKESSTEVETKSSGISGIPPEQENQVSHQCSLCNVTFHSKEEYKAHSHDSPHECNFCGKKYQSRLNLETHIKKYHEETEWMKYKCATCGKSFGFLLALERHMKEHNPNQKFCCDQCGKVFKNLANLKNHIPLHTRDEVYECPHCPKIYYIKYSYEKHLKTHECNPQYHCDICDRKFIEKKQFEVHLERHQISGSHGRSKDFKCNSCGDIKTKSDLDLVGITDIGHHKTCVVCGKGLYKKYRYIVDHHESTSFPMKDERQREQCKWCGKYVLNLSRHIKNTHLGNDYVSCDLCGMVVTKASLPSHKNRKHGGSKVTCDHCNQTFKNVMCLQEHRTKVRRKEDPSRNVCKFCKESVSADNWKEHMTKHKSKCSDCGAAHFSTHEEFLAHLDSCRRCSNCNLSTFVSREEFLNHIEICSSGIDVITSSLDSANEQEVVTSIFAIVDGNTCEICGLMFSDPESLAQHIADEHPETIPASHVFGDSSMISEAILYACPKDTCGAIVTSKDLLKSHMSSVHNVPVGGDDPGVTDDTQRYLYSSVGFKSLM